MMVKGKTIKIGLIGCGKVVVNRHLPVLKSIKKAEVIAAADIDGDRLKHAADKFQINRRFVDYNELLSDPDVEAVAICVPLRFHFEVALATLDAGKHLLLEKPLTMSMDEADQLVEQATKTDKKVMVGLNKRWHRLVRKARGIIQTGLIGPVGLMNMIFSTGHYNRPIPEWRLRRKEGGGSLIENGTHYYDMWRFLLQSDIEEIWAVSGSTEKVDDEPSIVTARTESGVYLNCVLSDFLPDRNVIEIFGRDCVLRISLHRFDGLEIIPLHSCDGDVRNRLKTIARFFKELPQGILQARYGGDYNASFRAQWKHFIDCIQQDTPVECTLEDGRRALQVAFAAVESASVGQPVKVAQAPRKITLVAKNIPLYDQRD